MKTVLCDCVTRIRNGYMAGLESVDVVKSNFVSSVLDVLQKEGFIIGYQHSDNNRITNVSLRYLGRKPAIKKIAVISKPSLPVYTKKPINRRLKNRYGIFVVSTTKGVFPHYVVKDKIGGEILLELS